MLAETHPPTPDSATPTNGRDTKGRFTRGNRCGHGNPFARRVAALRTTFLHEVQEEDLKQIAQLLIGKAKAGDLVAAKLVLSYALGRPADPPDPDRLDVDEWDLLREQVKEPEEDQDRFRWGRRASDVLPLVKAGLELRAVRDQPIGQELLDEIDAELLHHQQERAAKAAARPSADGPQAEGAEVDRPSANGSDGPSAGGAEASRPSANGSDGGSRPVQEGTPGFPQSPNAVLMGQRSRECQRPDAPRRDESYPDLPSDDERAAVLAQLTALLDGLTGQGRDGPPPSSDGGDGG